MLVISTKNRETEEDCNILCYKDLTCKWWSFTATDNVCTLYQAGCTLTAEAGTTMYRTFDFIDPDTTVNTCTHTEVNGRDTGKRATCSGHANVTECYADSDCQWNPTPPIHMLDVNTAAMCPLYNDAHTITPTTE